MRRSCVNATKRMNGGKDGMEEGEERKITRTGVSGGETRGVSEAPEPLR